MEVVLEKLPTTCPLVRVTDRAGPAITLKAFVTIVPLVNFRLLAIVMLLLRLTAFEALFNSTEAN